jgi:hypothetical protein
MEGPESADAERNLDERFRMAAQTGNFSGFSGSARRRNSKFGGAVGPLRVFARPAPFARSAGASITACFGR